MRTFNLFAVMAGYDGKDSRSFVVALSSKTPGNYTLSDVTDVASLGTTRTAFSIRP